MKYLGLMKVTREISDFCQSN